MFKKTKAKTVEGYLDSLPADRRGIVEALDEIIRKTEPELAPHFAHNMLGYGSFAYKNYKKEIVDWPIIAVANQKNYVSIYICALSDGEYLAEKYKDKLGKVSVGKSCIRLKHLEDIDMPTLKKLIKAAAKNPGLV